MTELPRTVFSSNFVLSEFQSLKQVREFTNMHLLLNILVNSQKTTMIAQVGHRAKLQGSAEFKMMG